MHEIHLMGGGSRFFAAAAAGAGDRRLRPHSHHTQNNAHHNQAALKCPRCDSLNTKFCYYNNYNLSQPRHFCKNCRRYWTKGGVLRNVPVGGGCRKSKRSSNSKTKTKTATSTSETTSSQQEPPPEQKSNSHSSSESSSLTAATNTTAAVTELNSDSSNNNLHDSKLLIPSNPSLESNDGGVALEQGSGDCGGIFSEIGTFSSLIASSSSNNNALGSFGFGGGGGVTDAASFQWQHQKLSESISGSGVTLLDPHGHGNASVTVDLSALQGKTGNGGFGALDWQGGEDQGLFDLPNAVDQAYWSHTEWHDQDTSTLFHLP